MTTNDEWCVIRDPKLENSQYRISRDGKILNTRTKKVLKTCVSNFGGYPVVTLRIDGKVSTFRVHILVAKTFIPNPENKEVVNHKNEDKLDCRAENLEWLTVSENLKYGTCQQRKSLKMSRAIEQLDVLGNPIRWWASAKYLCEDVGFPYSNDLRPTSLYRAINEGRAWNGMTLRWSNRGGEQ